MTKKEILVTLKNIKSDYSDLGIDIIGIFGSVAKGNATEKSDLDILYDTQKGIENLYEKKQILRKKIETTFGVKVDLASRKYLKPYIKDEIMKDLIYV